MGSLSNLFSPISIGTMQLKNRIAMAPMATSFANDDGTVSPQLRDYLEWRARGGAGLIITGVATVDRFSPYAARTIGLWDDSLIPAFAELTKAAHAHGAAVAPQLAHPGPESLSPFFHKVQAVGPSAVMCYSTRRMCRELGVDEIEAIVEQFGDAARRAREAGCDAVELHAAHSYLLVGSFLSALRNRRTDAYGGSIHGRLKFPLEVIRSIRAKAGADFPIIVRLSGDELVPGGRDIRGTQFIAPILAEAGASAFHISSGVFPQKSWRILPPTGSAPALNVGFSAAVKQVVDVPVMVVGRISDPHLAEDILKRNEADVIVMGRALLADPDLPRKAAEGRFDDIAPCIGCGLGCIKRGRDGMGPLSCVVNPTVGREREMALKPAAERKKVMVVGAGPGGLEAARVAALRGHEVTVYEKDAGPGGQFNLAAVPPLKQELTKVISYLATQLDKAGVVVKLNTEVGPELVEQTRPDVVIVATGGEPFVPKLPGVEGEKVVSAHEVLSCRQRVRARNIVVIGGGMVGCEVADFLANAGDNPVLGRVAVRIITSKTEVGLDMVPEGRTLLMQRLREKGVEIVGSATVKELFADGVLFVRDGKEEAIRGVDLIVLARGARVVDRLSARLSGVVGEVYVIGDAREPRTALEAIAEGAEVARTI